MDYSKPQLEGVVIKEPSERPEKERRIDNIMRMITIEEVVRFVISVTPTILSIIYSWYNSRKNRGQISIQTADGKVIKLDAKSVKNFKFIEKKRKRKKSTRKRGIAHRARSAHN